MKNLLLIAIIIVLMGCNSQSGNRYYYFRNMSDSDIRFKIYATAPHVKLTADSIVKSMEDVWIFKFASLGWNTAPIDSVFISNSDDTVFWSIADNNKKYIPFWNQLKWQETRDENYDWHYFLELDNSLFGDSYYYFYNKTSEEIKYRIFLTDPIIERVGTDSVIPPNDSILVLKSDEPYIALGFADSFRLCNRTDTLTWTYDYEKNNNVLSPDDMIFYNKKWRNYWDEENRITKYCLDIDSTLFLEQ